MTSRGSRRLSSSLGAVGGGGSSVAAAAAGGGSCWSPDGSARQIWRLWLHPAGRDSLGRAAVASRPGAVCCRVAHNASAMSPA